MNVLIISLLVFSSIICSTGANSVDIKMYQDFLDDYEDRQEWDRNYNNEDYEFEQEYESEEDENRGQINYDAIFNSMMEADELREEEEEELIENVDGFPPPSQSFNTTDIDGNCDCKKIFISSIGPAAQLHGDAMGTYRHNYVHSTYNGKPAYTGLNDASAKRLYFLTGSGWLIGTKLGNTVGFIHNANQFAQCPYFITDEWMYINNGYW